MEENKKHKLPKILNISFGVVIGLLIASTTYLGIKNDQNKKEYDSKSTQLLAEKAELQIDIENKQNQISTFEAEKETLNNQIAALNARISQLVEEMTEMSEDTEEAKDEVESLRSTVANLQTQLAAKTTEIATLTSQISSLQTQLETANTTIASLQADLNKFTVFYSVGGTTKSYEIVKRGENCKDFPSFEGENYTVEWSSEGKNITSNQVIYGERFVTVTFENFMYTNNEGQPDEEEVPSFIYTKDTPYKAKYDSLMKLDFETDGGTDYFFVTIEGEEVARCYENPEVQGFSFNGWDITTVTEAETNYSNGTIFRLREHTTVKPNNNACILGGTLISMADGTYKPVEEVKAGEEVLAYSFFKGEIVTSEVFYVMPTLNERHQVITLNLSNGKTLSICGSEYVFNMETRKWILVNDVMAPNLVGTRIMTEEKGERSEAIIVSTNVEEKVVDCYTICTKDTVNYIGNGVVGHELQDFINSLFSINEAYKIDVDQLNVDVATYGLFTYEELQDYISYESYISGFYKYGKILIGKGYISYEGLIQFYSDCQAEIYSNK